VAPHQSGGSASSMGSGKKNFFWLFT
jgi:hypothetical protein